ncbi:ribbon-helix-helix protein, CopG family [Pseudomonas lopnurensis]|uniref:ribbon-helix-helix protein, CopG family n=1 Tax=Pseudomonas lopnurensis TaxID=1477517 RepID=UPI0028A60A51|nr:ribbon-helix-helix protein, CopG family [Pseudomonas lopnurensis]
MTTTTIRMPEELKERVRQVASRTGTSTHAFILQAIEEKAEQAALRHDFDETANQRYARILESGETIGWSEMRRYLEDSAKGERPSRPTVRKMAP